MKIALCVWGDQPASSEQIDRASEVIIEYTKYRPSVFTSYNANQFHSLWLVNHIKRQHELQYRKPFTGVLYVNSAHIDSVNSLDIVTLNPDRHTVYYHRDGGIIYYCDSLSGDYASLYVYNQNNKTDPHQDWLYHLRSYRLNLRRHNIAGIESQK